MSPLPFPSYINGNHNDNCNVFINGSNGFVTHTEPLLLLVIRNVIIQRAQQSFVGLVGSMSSFTALVEFERVP